MRSPEGSPFDGTLDLRRGGEAEMLTGLNQTLFAAVVSASEAFGHVRIALHPEMQRVFITIQPRWYARLTWPGVLARALATLRAQWLAQAEANCREILPDGFKLTMYYEPKRRRV